MAKFTGLLVTVTLVLALPLSSVSATTPRPLPTLTVVPLVDSADQFKHVRLYRGDFTLDETDFASSSQGGNTTEHAHVALTLHLTECYPENGGTMCEWSGYVSDASLGDAEESGCPSGTLGEQKQTNLLARLFLDFAHGTYRLNTSSVDFPCQAAGGTAAVGAFTTGDGPLPPYNAPICGTMRVTSAGASDQSDNWKFTPTLDNHVSVRTSNVSCPEISPPPPEQ